MESTVRPSPAFYNTCEDVDRLIAVLRPDKIIAVKIYCNTALLHSSVHLPLPSNTGNNIACFVTSLRIGDPGTYITGPYFSYGTNVFSRRIF